MCVGELALGDRRRENKQWIFVLIQYLVFCSVFVFSLCFPCGFDFYIMS